MKVLTFNRRHLAIQTRYLVVSAVLIALGVALSPLSIPVGPSRVYPWQHMINALAGVMIGPWHAVFIAVVIGVLRNSLGTGTIFAFPGGVPGALVVGLIHRYILRKHIVALTEPIGTALGAVISAFIIAPFAIHAGVIKAALPVQVFIIAFLASSIPGAFIGYFALLVLERTGVLNQFKQQN